MCRKRLKTHSGLGRYHHQENNMSKKILGGCACTCCGSWCEWPQFHNGKPYGYTCILKVNPKAKRSKKEAYVTAESIEVGEPDDEGMIRVSAKYNGVSYSSKVSSYYLTSERHSHFLHINPMTGLIRVFGVFFDRNMNQYTDKVWRNTTIDCGVVYDVNGNALVKLRNKPKK